MTDSHTTSGAIVKSWFDRLAQQGVALNLLEEKTEIDYQQLEDLDTRIPLEQHYRLMETGIELTNNPALGLHMGETFSPDELGVVGHVFMNCPTLREAGNQVIRYSKLICDVCYMELQETEHQALFVLMHDDPRYDTVFSTEVALASAITWVRKFLEKSVQPLEVRFQHAPPKHLEEYERIFQGPILFNQPHNAIVFKREVMNYQLPSYNPYLRELLTKHADELLGQLNTGERIQDRVQEFIFDHLPTGEVDIESVADHMNMSRWTLNRKLKEEGTSFQELFKQMRKKLAMNYLQKKKLSITEVAFLVGFSEPSTFYRAFKSWAGQSPGEFRKAQIPLSVA